MKNKLKKTLLWLSIIIFAALIGWRIFELINKEQSVARNQSGGMLAVETESVRKGDIYEVKNFSGSILPLYQYEVSARVSGILVQMNKKEGDYVSGNEVIALLDDREYQLAFEEAQANLAAAEANLRESESQKTSVELDFRRTETLFRQEFISSSEFEKAQATYNSVSAKVELAAAQVQQRAAALHLAEIKLENTALRATQPGYIAARYFDEGNLLNVNAAVVSVVGMDTVLIRASLVEEIYSRIETGLPAAIRVDAYPQEIFSGSVTGKSAVLNQLNRMADMEIEVPNPGHLLKPGMFCQIALTLSESKNAQLVPSKAVIRDNFSAGLYVVEEGKAKYLKIIAGISDGQNTEILSPQLTLPIITLGQYQVKNGSKVQIAGSSKPKDSSK